MSVPARVGTNGPYIEKQRMTVWNKVMDYILGFLHASWTAEGTGWICTGFRIRYGEQEKGFYWQNAGVPHLNHWIFQIVTLTTDPIWSACHLIHVEPAQVWWILHASICRIHGGVCELCSWKLCQRGLGGQGGFANLWKQITQILVYVILLFRVPKAFRNIPSTNCPGSWWLSWIGSKHTHIYIYMWKRCIFCWFEFKAYVQSHVFNCQKYMAKLNTLYIYIHNTLWIAFGSGPSKSPSPSSTWPAGKHWSTGSWDDVSCSLRNI